MTFDSVKELVMGNGTREEAWGKVPVGAARAVLMRASVVKRGAMNFMITAYWIKNRTLIELEV
jgi:hypothetical protein